MSKLILNKRMKGQFFTISNPFYHDAFYKWISNIPNFDNKTILEPFTGLNNIVNLIESLGIVNKWKCFDIEPQNEISNNKKYFIEERDTIKNFPKNFDVVITNPPYLAKNSATRMGIKFPETHYNDLYKESIHQALESTKYVAAIIPESFIVQNIFHDRLKSVISLTCKMFNDTEHPVCLALFVPKDSKEDIDDFDIYSGERLIGNYKDLSQYLTVPKINALIKFNIPNGEIGLIAIDNTSEASIKFVHGKEIDSSKIKPTSRSLTKISVETTLAMESIINKANQLLSEHRIITQDLFLTSFKGLRKDGKYRRRLDFRDARRFLNLAIEEVQNEIS